MSESYSSIVGLSSSKSPFNVFSMPKVDHEFISAGALAMLLYDYFLTLDDEVEIIWTCVLWHILNKTARS